LPIRMVTCTTSMTAGTSTRAKRPRRRCHMGGPVSFTRTIRTAPWRHGRTRAHGRFCTRLRFATGARTVRTLVPGARRTSAR
jgi:hypothetical protein